MTSVVDLPTAAQRIREGGIVAFPTETVYGLGGNAWDAQAVAQIFERKGRPRFDPLIVHIAEAEVLAELASEVPPQAWQLVRRFWPGPLTLVLPKQPRVPDLVTAGLPSVAVRLPAHPVAQQLIREAGVPIAAPSANLFGRISPTTAAHVQDQFGDTVPVLDAGPCPVGVESTILSLVHDRPQLLRPGGLPLEEIEEVLGPVERAVEGQRPEAPGQLPSHYAPTVPLTILDQPTSPPVDRRVGLLAFRGQSARTGFAAVEVLSAKGDLREAAANLFAAMRRLDALELDEILAEPVPEVGLGRAIMDRLRRAAARRD